MTFLAIYFPFIVSFLTGYLVLHLLFHKKEDMEYPLKIFLAGGLGMGINASLTFLNFVCFDKFVPHFVIGINLVILGILAAFTGLTVFKNRTDKFSKDPAASQNFRPYLLLTLAAVPLWYQAWFFVNGGWDLLLSVAGMLSRR